MRSKLGKFFLLLTLWWFSDRVSTIFNLGLLLLLLRSLYEVYLENVSDRHDVITPRKDTHVVVVTGCDSGIGKAAADKLLDKFHVIATVLDDQSPAAFALRSRGAEIVKLDLTDEARVKTAAAEILALLTGTKVLHGVVNNAGISISGELDWFDPEVLTNMMKVNLTSPVLLTKLLLPRIIKDKARIINVTGLDGLSGVSGLVAYCSSKIGMEGFTEALRLEMEQHEVRVIAVRPGDYSSLTDVAEMQKKHRTAMWSSMDKTKRERYGAYFDAFSRSFTNSGRFLSAANFDGIRNTFEEALLSENPADEYDEGNNLNVLLYKLAMLLPKKCSGRLRSWCFRQVVNVHLYRQSSEML